MSAWKCFERDVARLIGGRRYPANGGGTIDVESLRFIAQCKLVKTLSLEALTRLVEQADADGQRKGKSALVAVKVRRGRGTPSPTLLVMSAGTFAALVHQGSVA